MRQKHEIENKFETWKRAGYGNKELDPIQEQEIRRAFMGGVFEGLNFMIAQLEKSPAGMEAEIGNLYTFLKAFHENEIKVNKKSPFGNKYY